MMTIKQDGALYQYLAFSFNIARKNFPTMCYDTLEYSDFCKIVRVSLIYVPFLFIFQYGVLATVSYMLFEQIWYSNNSGEALMTVATILAFVVGVGLALGLLAGSPFIISDVIARLKNKKTQNAISVDGKQTPVAEVTNFVKEGYSSLKHRYCVTVKFEKEDTKND